MKLKKNRSEWSRRLGSLFLAFATACGSSAGVAHATEPVPVAHTYDASAAEGDLPTVSGNSGIRFGLYNYAGGKEFNINMKSPADGSEYDWRDNAEIFQFIGAGSAFSGNNPLYDQKDFEINHATVERKLVNGYPVQDITRNALGEPRPGVDASDFPQEVRNLSYLFGGGDPYDGVTAYSPSNTLLQTDGRGGYFFNSAQNAVDYDIQNSLFRVRDYTERCEATAEHSGIPNCYDFLPFNYTGGHVIGKNKGTGMEYHVKKKNTDYWFGMTMEVEFYMPKDGKFNGEDMVFSFSGDDDVWVFVDDVLVLDLGGIHGTVDGSINFATGDILQYLSWKGANSSESDRVNGSDTSFPTTLEKCYSSADTVPNGGWNQENTNIFANYTKHKLKFYYLERGAGVANCKMYFNLPTVEDNTLTVGKALSAIGPESDFASDLGYDFRVWKANADGTRSDELLIPGGTEFKVYTDGQTGGEYSTVGENGIFTLKAGQRGQFGNLLNLAGNADGYIIEELIPSNMKDQYGSVTHHVNGVDMGEIQGEPSDQEGYHSYFSCYIPLQQEENFNMVMFTNVVDTEQLSTLKVSKQVEPGSFYDPEEKFPIQVTLGGELLPVGTEYVVGEETRVVDEPGILWLAGGETATISKKILSGTPYEITEDASGWKTFYSGIVTNADGSQTEIKNSDEGICGEMPLNSEIHVTVHNQSFDFGCSIPITKTLVGNPEGNPVTFSFVVEDSSEAELPGASITVTNNQKTPGQLVIGFQDDVEPGEYTYTVREVAKTDDGIIYDPAIYQVTIAVGNDQSAKLMAITRDGKPVDGVDFVNYIQTSLTLKKIVTGNWGDYERKFQFTATATVNGEPYLSRDLELGHEESVVLDGIPYGAVVTITETNPGSYTTTVDATGTTVTTKNDGTGVQTITAPLTTEAEVVFTNHLEGMIESGVVLDSLPYAFLLCSVAAGAILMFAHRRRKDMGM